MLVFLLLVSLSGANSQSAPRITLKHSICNTPKLVGLTVTAARQKSLTSSCHLVFRGSTIKRPSIQTIRTQSPSSGTRDKNNVVTVWVNPLCTGSADQPPKTGPKLTKGPTELVSGLYLSGGPSIRRSTSHCASFADKSGAGTVIVLDPLTGSLIAQASVPPGRLVKIPLLPGTYEVYGIFRNVTINGAEARTDPISLVIPDGETVRQDMDLSIP
jgi:hypothetical protein